MKRNFVLTLLILTALCVVTTGCGRRKDDPVANNNNNNTVQDTMQDPAQSGGNSSSGSIMDDVEEGLDNAGDAITGNNNHPDSSQNGATSGVPYDDLLSDGSVTDQDGNLNNDTAAKNRSR